MSRLNRNIVRRFLLAAATLPTIGASCEDPVRFPLPVPVPPIEGSRPVSPSSLHAGLTFGDGVRGEEQERVELWGLGLGVSVRDRASIGVGAQWRTRLLEEDNTIWIVDGKLRLADFDSERGSIGVHLARSSTENLVPANRMTALDFALPIEYRPMGREASDSRLALYAGPRLIRESFVDRDTFGSSTRGLLFGGFMGAVGRWRFVTVSGEMNVARTPTLELGDEVFRGGWIGLPSVRVTAVLPF